MMECPEREADIVEFALWMAECLEQHPDALPGIPVSAAELRAAVDACHAAQTASVVADSTLRERHETKDQALVAAKDAMKANLRYADVEVRGQPEKLSGLGWGGRPGATDREPPGEVRDIALRSEGDTWLVLEWRPPIDGGPAATYRVQRRRRGGAWEFVATAVDNDCLLSGQPRGIEFEYRVIAVNKAGTGQPSATVTVVL